RHGHGCADGCAEHPLRFLATAPDLRAITDHLDDGVTHPVPGLGDPGADLGEQLHTVCTRPLVLSGTEHRAEVAEPRCGQQRVAQRVRGHVTVRMAGAAVGVRPMQARKPALPSRFDRMDVDSLADPHACPSPTHSTNRDSATVRSNAVLTRIPCGCPGTVRTAKSTKASAFVMSARRRNSAVNPRGDCVLRSRSRSLVRRTTPVVSTTFTVSVIGSTGTAAVVPSRTAATTAPMVSGGVNGRVGSCTSTTSPDAAAVECTAQRTDSWWS